MIDRLRYGKPVSADRVLNHLIAWTAILLVLSVLGFGGYYYYDRLPGSTGPTPAQRTITVAEDAVNADPSALTPRLALADVYYAANRFKESAEQYQAALGIDDKNLLATWGLGRALLAMGDGNGAEPNFQKVLDASQNADIRGDLVGASYFYLGKIALSRNDADSAIGNFKSAVAIDRADADAMQLLGVAYLAKGSYDDAIEQLKKAIRFVPNFTEAYTQLALAYDGKGLANEARYAKGMELFSQGQVDKAAKEMEATVAALPSFADGFTGLGLIREKQGQRSKAIDAYQQALALDANNFTARYGLTRLGVVQPTDTTNTHGSSEGGSQ